MACLAAAALCAIVAAGCRREEPEPPPVATPSFSANQTRVPLGSPVEVTYKFVVANDAPKITENFRVFVHFLDPDGYVLELFQYTGEDQSDAPPREAITSG